MALSHSPSVVTDSLLLHFDAANIKSYPGTGTVWTDTTGISTGGGSLVGNSSFSTVPDRIETNAISQVGYDDRLSITNTLTLNDGTAYSLEFWFKLRSTPTATYHSLTGLGSTTRWFGVEALDTGVNSWRIFFRRDGGAYDYSTTITNWNIAANWTQVVLSVNADRTFSYYYNGQLINSSSHVITTMVMNRLAGGYSSGGNFYTLQGALSVAKVHSRALTAVEVARNFNALRGRYGI